MEKKKKNTEGLLLLSKFESLLATGSLTLITQTSQKPEG
jgi:hypothetical protein